MRFLRQVILCGLLVGGVATAQRGGGGMRSGGSGMYGGAGGGNFAGFRGGFMGGGTMKGPVGPTRVVFVGSRFPSNPVSVNGVGLPFINVSFPFGLGFPAQPLGFAPSLGLANFNNRFFVSPGLNNGFWGGIGGLGFSNVGAGFSNVGAASLDSPLNAVVYPAEPVVQPLSAERASPVIHEYDQSGREVPAARSVPSVAAAVYPQEPSLQPRSGERARPVIREYDQSGQELGPAGLPLYLIAFDDHTIRAVTSYRVDGNTLNYSTPEREQRQAPLSTVDRALSGQLNRERQVHFELPAQ
jgi:hypothetical protein